MTRRRTRSSTAIAVASVVVLAGCSASSPPSRQTEGTERSVGVAGHASATAGVAPSIDPCSGVDACAHVADADIDGDGSLDPIGIAPGATVDTVVVALAGKPYRLDQKVAYAGYSDPREIYRGSFLMSRAQGSDIVLHLIAGQGNAEQFAVVTWDGTQLVSLPRPPTADYQGGRDPQIWYLGSSHGKIDTIACRQPGEIAATTLTAATAEGMPVPGGGRREENYYIFSGATWQPSGSENVADASFSYQFDAHTQAFRCDDQGRAPS